MVIQEDAAKNSIIASVAFSAGDAIGLTSGTGRPVVTTDTFIGFATNSGVSGDRIELIATGQGNRVVVAVPSITSTTGVNVNIC